MNASDFPLGCMMDVRMNNGLCYYGGVAYTTDTSVGLIRCGGVTVLDYADISYANTAFECDED